MSTLSLPLWKHVDVLVLGATTTAVSAALAAAARGRSVAVVADETYLGQDLAGTLHLWEDPDADTLVSAARTGSGNPARPGALKRHLEQALLAAGIPFLYGTRSVGFFRDGDDRVCGAVLATRTALMAATCDQLVDASLHGTPTRFEGYTVRPRRTDVIRWRVLAEAVPTGWPGSARELRPAYRQVVEGKVRDYTAFELCLSTNLLPADRRTWAHAIRALFVDEKVWIAADHLLDPGGYELDAGPAVAGPDQIPDATFQVADRLWAANTLLPVSRPEDLLIPGVLSAMGQRVGVLAAAACGTSRPCVRNLHTRTARAADGPFSFTEVFLRNKPAQVVIDDVEFPEWEPFDVVVAGGGTAGAPAAIAAARSGAKTLCLESGHSLGGVGTLGLISSYWFGNKCGFTTELDERLSRADSLSRAKNGNSWQPSVKASLYHQMLAAAHGTAWMDSFVFGVRRKGNRPDGVLVSTPQGWGFVAAKTFVDATGNADLAAASGAHCRVMDGRHAAVQGTGLSPKVHPAVGYQNSDHTFVEDNDPEGLTLAHAQAREKYPNAFDTSAFINSRERRQIEGDLEVSPLDILAGRTFPDTIFSAKSNFDTHGFIVHPVFMVAPPDHKALRADVPLRSMLPRGIEGVLVTGLGMSAHRDALPVIRMQADVQNQGYAAGLLAARCAQTGTAFRAVDIRAFQRELVRTGILDAETAAHEDSFPLPENAIATAARGALSSAHDVAVVFAHPDQSLPRLLDLLHSSPDPEIRRRCALILGLMARPEATPVLADLLADAPWDEGWNYRGMGQFGPSMSTLDALIIAAGRTRDRRVVPPLVRLAGTLTADAEFSHCRALALAAAGLRDPGLTAALDRLLDLPGFTGHTFLTAGDILADNDGDTTSTRSRNLALRELYTARGIFLGGGTGTRGQAILESYARDLRGHFARHARSVLSAGPDSPPGEMA